MSTYFYDNLIRFAKSILKENEDLISQIKDKIKDSHSNYESSRILSKIDTKIEDFNFGNNYLKQTISTSRIHEIKLSIYICDFDMFKSFHIIIFENKIELYKGKRNDLISSINLPTDILRYEYNPEDFVEDRLKSSYNDFIVETINFLGGVE